MTTFASNRWYPQWCETVSNRKILVMQQHVYEYRMNSVDKLKSHTVCSRTLISQTSTSRGSDWKYACVQNCRRRFWTLTHLQNERSVWNLLFVCRLPTRLHVMEWAIQWRSQKFSTGGASICSIPFCIFPFSCPTKSAVPSKTSWHIIPSEWLNEQW